MSEGNGKPSAKRLIAEPDTRVDSPRAQMIRPSSVCFQWPGGLACVSGERERSGDDLRELEPFNRSLLNSM